MYKLLKISGFVTFIAAVIFVILFAEGYQYDRGKGDLVKKSVIYFDMPFAAPDVDERILMVDGAPVSFSFPGELRVTPGVHDIEIRREGFNVWKKRIEIREDSVVRFPEIRLFPIRGFKPQYLQPVSVFQLRTASEKGVLIEHPYLHFGKYYRLKSDAPFEIVEEMENVEEIGAVAEVKEISGGWSSRIGETFHFLFLTPERSLLFCDEDGENCHELARTDTNFIQASEDRTVFFTILRSEFVLFDFGADSLLPRLFENLVSGASDAGEFG